MSSIHELLKQVYPLNLRMELFNAIWTGWRTDIKEKDQQISDLEAKLAEKDAELEKWSTKYAKAYVNRQNALIAEKVELQHQLAEKDKEVSNLNGLVRERDKQIKNLKTNKKRVIEHINKTKISLAVEQLEKVKELCKEKFNWWENSEWEGDIYDKADVSNAYFDIEANIEDKIKQLKGE